MSMCSALEDREDNEDSGSPHNASAPARENSGPTSYTATTTSNLDNNTQWIGKCMWERIRCENEMIPNKTSHVYYLCITGWSTYIHI